MDKAELFAKLVKDVASCHDCSLCDRTKNKVNGEGDLNARVVFVGEAPGRREDELGRPFVGSAGKLFDGLLMGAGLSRGEVFISNVIRCRPPGNRRPTRKEIEACSCHLDRLLEIIRPRVIAPMGNSAIGFFFGKYGMEHNVIGDVHGVARVVDESWGEVVLFPLYHPAAAIYDHGLLGILASDMATLKRIL